MSFRNLRQNALDNSNKLSNKCLTIVRFEAEFFLANFQNK